MVDAEKHRKLKENHFLNWNIEKRLNTMQRQADTLNSFINVGNQCRTDLKFLDFFKI